MSSGLIAGRLARERFASCQRALDRQRQGTATGARSQLDRHADRVVHRSYNLRAAARGQIDSNERRLKDRAATLAKSSLRSVNIGQEDLWRRTRRLALLPVRRLEVQDLRVDQWRRLWVPTIINVSWTAATRSPGIPRGRWSARPLTSVAGSVLLTQVSDGELMSTVNDGGRATPHRDAGGTNRPRGTWTKGTDSGCDAER